MVEVENNNAAVIIFMVSDDMTSKNVLSNKMEVRSIGFFIGGKDIVEIMIVVDRTFSKRRFEYRR